MSFRPKILIICLTLVLSFQCNLAQEISTRDWLVTGSGLGLTLAMELYAKDKLVPDTPRFSTPNSFDKSMREKLWFGLDGQENARTWSNILIYGVSVSSLIWGPLLAEDSKIAILINSRVFAANNLLTNFMKIGAARERPYSHFASRTSEGSSDYTSFYSGHSSVAFSQAVCNAMLLSRSYPGHETKIWSTLLGVAGVTAYLRIAGDMHYFSDVMVGAIMGSLVSWSITKRELKRFTNTKVDSQTLMGIQTRDSTFMVSLKIPLG